MTTPRSQIGLGGAGLADGSLRSLLGQMVLAFDFVNVPATVDNQIVAAVAGNTAPALTVAANPDIPRNLVATFQASYDGGDLLVVGTDQFGNSVSETLAANAGSTRVGSKCFKTVDSVTRSTTGATANTVTLGTGLKIGIPAKVKSPVHIFTCDGTSESATLDAVNNTVASTTAPNGSHDYKLMVSPA